MSEAEEQATLFSTNDTANILGNSLDVNPRQAPSSPFLASEKCYPYRIARSHVTRSRRVTRRIPPRCNTTASSVTQPCPWTGHVGNETPQLCRGRRQTHSRSSLLSKLPNRVLCRAADGTIPCLGRFGPNRKPK